MRAVSRHGSLTAAATALGVTAGALSRRVAAVESWLGTTLFERHGRGMRLTPDGQRFMMRIEEAFSLIEAAADPWRRKRGPDVVRISVVPSFARFWLLDRLDALERGWPGTGGPRLRIEVAVEHRHADVEGGDVDLAIRYGRGPWPGLEAKRLMAESIVPVARADLAGRIRHADDGEPDIAALLALPLLYDSDAVGWRAWLKEAGLPRFRPRPHDRRFEDYSLVIAAAQAGLGVALARLPFAASAIKAMGLVTLSGREVDSPLAYHVVKRPNESRTGVLTLAARLSLSAGA